MKITYKGYPIEAVDVNGDVFVPFRRIFTVIFDFQSIRNITKELRGVSINNYIISGKGRGQKTLINGNGLAQVLNRTIRLSYSEKLDAVKSMRESGLTVSEAVSATRKELDFADDLRDFLHYFGKSLDRQVVIGDGFIYDIVIGDLIVEFDENNHKNYNKDSEILREENAKNHGYRLVRVSDLDSNATGLAKVSEALI